MQYSNASSSSENSEPEVEDSEDPESQESADIKSEESPTGEDRSNAEINDTSTTSSGETDLNDTSKRTLNTTSGILGRGFDDSRANLTLSPQISNQTNQTRQVPKSDLGSLGEELPTLEQGPCIPGSIHYPACLNYCPGYPSSVRPPCPPPPPLPDSAVTEAKVTFNSMKVRDDHEGTFSGDGEYDVVAYVIQGGVKVDLTEASGPGSGLWDVSSGETVTFDPGTEVVLRLTGSGGLAIFTVGTEKDNSCGSTSVLPNPMSGSSWPSVAFNLERIGIRQDELNGMLEEDEGILCGALNSNDVLGKMAKIHSPFETYPIDGTFSVDSDSGDFTLTYTIQTKRIQ